MRKRTSPFRPSEPSTPTRPRSWGPPTPLFIFWRRKMPFKSRDAHRIWGKNAIETAAQEIAAAEEREAVEIPLADD